jgi:hypothetical protein
VPPELRLDSFHLVTPGGTVRSAGDAAAPLAGLLPAGRLPARLFERYPERTESAYRWISRHRSTFGRLGLRSRGRIPEVGG